MVWKIVAMIDPGLPRWTASDSASADNAVLPSCRRLKAESRQLARPVALTCGGWFRKVTASIGLKRFRIMSDGLSGPCLSVKKGCIDASSLFSDITNAFGQASIASGD